MAAGLCAGILLRATFGKTDSNQNRSLNSPLKATGMALCFQVIASDLP